MASFSTSLPPMVWPNLMETKKFCTTRHGRGATIKVSDLSEGTARIEENWDPTKAEDGVAQPQIATLEAVCGMKPAIPHANHEMHLAAGLLKSTCSGRQSSEKELGKTGYLGATATSKRVFMLMASSLSTTSR